MKTLIWATAILSSFLCGSAFSENVAVPASYDWSGGYLGIDFGAALNNSGWLAPSFPPAFNTNGTGLAAGGVAGYRYQMNNLVVGVEGSADLLGVDGEANCVGTVPTCVTKQSFLGLVQANIGYAADRIHVYGSGGIAFGNYEHYETTTLNQSWGSESRIGWTVGAGMDYALNEKWIAGLRWNYYDFGTQTINTPFPVNFTENGNIVTARVEYKF